MRDKQFGVPHIYGDTRAALMFGIGYATAEDRLFFIDVLRHAGQGDLAAFAGGANVAMDQSVWAGEPYPQQDLVNQVSYGSPSQPDGAQVFADATSYVDGINAYIAKAEKPLNPLTMEPAEYVALGSPAAPAVHAGGHGLDRHPGRGDLRQRRGGPARQRRALREPRRRFGASATRWPARPGIGSSKKKQSQAQEGPRPKRHAALAGAEGQGQASAGAKHKRKHDKRKRAPTTRALPRS